jgi:hypothetical protein
VEIWHYSNRSSRHMSTETVEMKDNDRSLTWQGIKTNYKLQFTLICFLHLKLQHVSIMCYKDHHSHAAQKSSIQSHSKSKTSAREYKQSTIFHSSLTERWMWTKIIFARQLSVLITNTKFHQNLITMKFSSINQVQRLDHKHTYKFCLWNTS